MAQPGPVGNPVDLSQYRGSRKHQIILVHCQTAVPFMLFHFQPQPDAGPAVAAGILQLHKSGAPLLLMQA
ncbi:hypothetical protein D3C75_1338730 [compost metagenome]